MLLITMLLHQITENIVFVFKSDSVLKPQSHETYHHFVNTNLFLH